MLVSCPQCKAKYQLATTIKNAILVCHRCGAEFHTAHPEKEPTPAHHEVSLFEYAETAPEKEDISSTKTSDNHELTSPAEQTDDIDYLTTSSSETHRDTPTAYQEESITEQGIEEPTHIEPSSTKQADIEHDDIAQVQLSEERLLPERGPTRIWHWLIVVLLCMAGLGIWKNQHQWLAQPWVRSLMMNMQISVAPNPADWAILKDDIHSQWIDRQDHSRVLFINGYIQNRLLSDQTPPAIQISFFDMPNSRAIQTRTIAITEPPSLPTIRHAPYLAPAIDQVPVSAGGKRAFTLVLENVPEQAREISLVIATP